MHHIIFEGAELSGKSWIMSQIYDRLEAKYNRSSAILDGCHWFNCDVGVFGSEHGQAIIGNYLEMFAELQDKNLLIEKFHLCDLINNRLHRRVELDYSKTEATLEKLGFKIVLCAFPEDELLISARIADRLKLYPHYERILQSPGWYVEQQRQYLAEVKKSRLPYLIIESRKFPDQKAVGRILAWINES